MQKSILLWGFVLLLVSCKQKETSGAPVKDRLDLTISHAKGFEISDRDGVRTLIVNNPWPGADKSYSYALLSEGETIENEDQFDAVIQVPLRSIVVTSTTHIPSLEMIGETNALVGFPNLKYISSEKTRALIDAGKIKELGKNEDINTEVLIDLSPDALVTFAVEGSNKTVAAVQKTGIPVLYNADWTETTPLGKAEWVKFFGVLFNKEKAADSIFSEIERNYQEAKAIASSQSTKPTVLSGAMYKDVWYLPQGDSWAAQFIKDAHGEYLWSETEGVGSLSLNLESVLDKGESAKFWIGPGQFTSLNQMQEAHAVYEQFDAFKSGEVYSFTTRKGATGGVIYYELAPNRPDMVLRDIIKILHPNVLPDHELYFFSKIE